MLLLPLLIPLLQQGVYTPTDQAFQRRWLDVRQDGVFLVLDHDDARAEVLPGHSVAGVTSPRWQVDDLGLNWIGQRVALGDSGSWLLAGKELNNQSVGAYATGSDTPLFDFSVLGSMVIRPAIARRDASLAALVTADQGGFSFQSTVYSWDLRNSGTPSWSAVLPVTGNVIAGYVGMSEDGSRTVAVVSNTNGTTHIRVFDRAGGLLQSFDFAAAANLRFGALDSSASRLYLGMFNGFCEIYDLNTGALLHTQSLGGTFDSHAFSADGKTFAYGNFAGLFVVREITPGVWSTIASRSGVGSTYLGQAALNRDGSRCGFAVQRYSPNYDHLEIGMWDVNANLEIFNTSLDAPGTSLQLIAAGLAMDDAGDYLAGISWGDSLNLTPEAFVYDAAGNLTASLDTPGSAFGLAMDGDGDVVAVGTKSVHANISGNGGSVICLDAYRQDLHVLGFPQLGGSLSFETPDGASSAAFVLTDSLGASSSPFGTTEVDLATILLASGPHAIPTGGLALPLAVPINVSFLDTPIHVQCVRFSAGAVLTNKVSLRLVP